MYLCVKLCMFFIVMRNRSSAVPVPLFCWKMGFYGILFSSRKPLNKVVFVEGRTTSLVLRAVRSVEWLHTLLSDAFRLLVGGRTVHGVVRRVCPPPSVGGEGSTCLTQVHHLSLEAPSTYKHTVYQYCFLLISPHYQQRVYTNFM